MSILMAPERRISLRTVLKRVVLSRLGDNETFSLDCKEAFVGIGGAGIVGGVRVCSEIGMAELDAEAPGTYLRDPQNFAILTVASLEAFDSHEALHTRCICSAFLALVP